MSLLGKIEGPVWYTIYRQLPVVEGVCTHPSIKQQIWDIYGTTMEGDLGQVPIATIPGWVDRGNPTCGQVAMRDMSMFKHIEYQTTSNNMFQKHS